MPPAEIFGADNVPYAFRVVHLHNFVWLNADLNEMPMIMISSRRQRFRVA